MSFIKDLLTRFGITNSLGTILAVLGFVQYVFEKFFGCSPFATTAEVTCQMPSWVPANWIPVIMGAAGVIAVVTKALRPGTFWRNLFGATAVQVPKEVIEAKGIDPKGIVTPGQVASTSTAK